MIDVREAQRRLCATAQPLDRTFVDLGQAHDRVLAEAIRADRDHPPADRSAMDGYAVRAADVAEPGVVLRVAGELRAGQAPTTLRLGARQAVRVMTGSVVPAGADTVVMVESTSEDRSAGTVTIREKPSIGQHIRRRGQDLSAGEIVLEAGVPLKAPEIAALASVGASRVPVFRRPLVSVIATGDEVVEPEAVPAQHQVRNSNAPTLLSLLREHGVEGRYLGIAKDTPRELELSLEQGLAGADLLLVTGGVSAGEYDLVPKALARLGMDLLFHRVAMKPGKPVLAGRRGTTLAVGLPGNPVSTYAVFVVLVAPALRRMMGFAAWENRRYLASCVDPVRGSGGRETYHLARIEEFDGTLRARLVRSTGSGDVTALSRANGFLIAPAGGPDVESGARLPILPWSDRLFH